MRALKYFFDEASASLWRGLKTSIIATATIAVAFVVLGGFLILTANMERVFTRWQDAAEFSVYLSDAATSEQRAAIEKMLRGSASVAAVEAVSKDEALRRFKQNFGALAEAAGTPRRTPCRRRLKCGCARTRTLPRWSRWRRRPRRSEASPTCATTVNGFSV